MTQQTGGGAWTRKDGLCALEPILTSRDSGEMIHQEVMVFGFWKKESAVQQVNQVTPISLQPVEMKTGGLRWMGGLLEYAVFKGMLMMKGH